VNLAKALLLAINGGRDELSGEKVVDMVVTDLAVFTIDKAGKSGMTLIELAPGVSVDEVKAKTEAGFKIAAGL
jgi:3-oxoacid CoA-transferase subunit B